MRPIATFSLAACLCRRQRSARTPWRRAGTRSTTAVRRRCARKRSWPAPRTCSSTSAARQPIRAAARMIGSRSCSSRPMAACHGPSPVTRWRTSQTPTKVAVNIVLLLLHYTNIFCLQCFDVVGWAAGRACKKTEWLECCIMMFVDFILLGLRTVLFSCTPAVWQLWLNEYVMLCYALHQINSNKWYFGVIFLKTVSRGKSSIYLVLSWQQLGIVYDKMFLDLECLNIVLIFYTYRRQNQAICRC